MKRIAAPAIAHEPLYQQCVAQTGNAADRAVLQAMADRVVGAGTAYAAAAFIGGLDQIEKMPMTEAEENLIVGLYEKRLQDKRGAGRWAYEAILSAATRCPYCVVGEVYELDHFLPKKRSLFPDLNILPINLVPICHPCNHIKWEQVPHGPDEHFLHPYFDQLPTNIRWLFAEIQRSANGPMLKFSVRLDQQTYGALATRLDYHFRELHLERRFRRYAATILAELEAEITEYLAVLGATQMAAHFWDLGDKEFQRHGNTLECAAYFAAAASPAYCSGGYQN